MPARSTAIGVLTRDLGLSKEVGIALRRATFFFIQHEKRNSDEDFSKLTMGKLRSYAKEFLAAGHGSKYWPRDKAATFTYPQDKAKILDLLIRIMEIQRTNKKALVRDRERRGDSQDKHSVSDEDSCDWDDDQEDDNQGDLLLSCCLSIWTSADRTCST